MQGNYVIYKQSLNKIFVFCISIPKTNACRTICSITPTVISQLSFHFNVSQLSFHFNVSRMSSIDKTTSVVIQLPVLGGDKGIVYNIHYPCHNSVLWKTGVYWNINIQLHHIYVRMIARDRKEGNVPWM